MISFSPHISYGRVSLQKNTKLKSSQQSNFTSHESKQDIKFASSSLMTNYNKAFISFKGFGTPEVTMESIREITSDPRSAIQKRSELMSQYGDRYFDWLYGDYTTKFAEFTEKMFNETSSIEDLIKYRPDWKPSKLSEKFHQLNPCGDNFHFGNLPQEIGDRNTFNKIAEHLSTFQENSGLSSFNSFNYSSSPSSSSNSSVNIDGKNFNVKALSPGKSCKKPFLIEAENGKKFIIKIDPKASCFNHKLESCESIGLQAIIDYYLSSNDSPNSAKMYFYDEKSNAAIYEYVSKDDDYDKAYSAFSNTSQLASIIPDVFKLGVMYNDTLGSDNIIKSNNEYKMIDSGHCTFSNPFKPKVSQYHWELPNLMQFQF